MGTWTKTRINLDYTPSLTANKIANVLAKHFPEYPLVDQPNAWKWQKGDWVILKKRTHAVVCVRILQEQNKNRTQIQIWGGMLPAAAFYAGALWYFIAIGDLPEQVEAVIRKELPNMIAG